jgi:hypothetical protein
MIGVFGFKIELACRQAGIGDWRLEIGPACRQAGNVDLRFLKCFLNIEY